jgi:regulator of replication initiation timing
MQTDPYAEHSLIRNIRMLSGDSRPSAVLVHMEQCAIQYIEENARLRAENERLSAIVSLIGLKNERDALAKRVRELEEEIDHDNQAALGRPG